MSELVTSSDIKIHPPRTNIFGLYFIKLSITNRDGERKPSNRQNRHIDTKIITILLEKCSGRSGPGPGGTEGQQVSIGSGDLRILQVSGSKQFLLSSEW